MKTLLTLLMLVFLVSCSGDNTMDSGDKITEANAGVAAYSYNPVYVIHSSLSYVEFTAAVKKGEFLDNNHQNYIVTFLNYHIQSNDFGWIRINDDIFSREIINNELDYIFDSNSRTTSDYLDVVTMLNEIVESRDQNISENQIGPAAFIIQTISGVQYLIDLNVSILQNPVRMFDIQTEEGFDYYPIFNGGH